MNERKIDHELVLVVYDHRHIGINPSRGRVIHLKLELLHFFTHKYLLSMYNTAMKFVVDSMLGKLARRLRLLGYDTLFDPKFEDRTLLKLSKDEQRWIVTRDRGIAQVRGAKVLLIKSGNIEEQLKEISKLAGIKMDERTAFSRCSECNSPVEEVDKEKVRSIVPEFVYKTMDKFSYCPRCKKAYWRGTHYDKMKKQLGNI